MQLKWLQEALPGVLYRCRSVCTDWCRARGRLPLAAPRGGWTNGNGWGSRRWIAIGWNVGTCGVTTFTKWSTAKQHTVTFFRTCCSPTISQPRLPPRCERSVGQRDGMATRKWRGNSSWSWVSSTSRQSSKSETIITLWRMIFFWSFIQKSRGGDVTFNKGKQESRIQDKRLLLEEKNPDKPKAPNHASWHDREVMQWSQKTKGWGRS